MTERGRFGVFDRHAAGWAFLGVVVGAILTVVGQLAVAHFQLGHQDRSQIRQQRRDAYAEVLRVAERDTANNRTWTSALASGDFVSLQEMSARFRADEDAFQATMSKLLIIGTDADRMAMLPLVTSLNAQNRALLEWAADSSSEELRDRVAQTAEQAANAQAEFVIHVRG